MRRSSLLPHLSILILTLVLTACGTSTGGLVDDAPVIPDTTRIPDEETLSSLSEVEEDGTLVFASSNEFLASLDGGDVLVAEPSGAAPEGLLRRVTSVREEGGRVIVETEPASLEDAIDRGSVDVQRALTSADLESAQLHIQGVTLQDSNTQAEGFRFAFDQSLFDADGDSATTNDRLQISGYLEIEPILDFRLDLNKFLEIPTGVNVFRVAVGLTEHAELEVIGDYDQAGSFSQEFSLATLDFAPLTFPVGPVPVVITPELELSIRLDGSIDTTLRLRVEQNFTARAGVSYTGADGWQNLSELSHDFGWDDPTYGATLNARAYASARLGFKLYDSAGSYIKASAYGELDVDLFDEPIWQLNAGVTADVGVYAQILSFKLGDYSARVMDIGWNLDSGSTPAPDPKKVLIDGSHGFYYTAIGVTQQDYFQDLITVLYENGYTVDLIVQNFSTQLESTTHGVLLLAGPTASYSAGEVAVIGDWVERGGRLIALGEYEGNFNTAIVNQVIDGFGLQINGDLVADLSSNAHGDGGYPVTSRIHDSFDDEVFEVAFYSSASVSGGETVVQTEATGFATIDRGVSSTQDEPAMAARAVHGSGQVIALGDSDVFAIDYNNSSTGIRYYDNCQFALNVFGGGSDCSF